MIESFARKYMRIQRNQSGDIVQISRNKEAWKEEILSHGFLVLAADGECDIERAFEKYRKCEKIGEMMTGRRIPAGGEKAEDKNSRAEGLAFALFEALTLSLSFEAEIRKLIGKLALPSGNAEHDTEAAYQKEREAMKWLLFTSPGDLLRWFDTIRKIPPSGGEKACQYAYAPESLERDRIVLEGLLEPGMKGKGDR